MRDAAAEVIYVGKAADLRRRVSSHFNAKGRPAVAAGAKQVDVIITRSPYEAGVLESSLIRHHRPRLNRADPLDLGLWHLGLSPGPFPRLERIRPAVAESSDPGRVFGPCFSYREAEDLIAAVSDYFQLRTCNLDGTGKCARYHAGHCIPVCEEPERSDRYTRSVRLAAALLRGDTSALGPLRRRIRAAAAERRYERAAELTRRLRVLERGAVPQAVIRPGGGDAAVACARRLEDGRCVVTTLQVRSGALVALSRVDAGTGATPAGACRAALAPATDGLRRPVVIAETPAGSAGGGWVEPDLARGLLELARMNLADHPRRAGQPEASSPQAVAQRSAY